MLIILKNKRSVIALLICIISLFYSYYMQYVRGLHPCVLCMVERYTFIALVITLFIRLLVNNFKILAVIGDWFAVVISIFGITICWHHYHLQNSFNDSKFISCGMPLEIYYNQNSLLQFIKYILYENVECAKSVVMFFGVNILILEVTTFVILIVLTLLNFLKDNK